MAPIKWTQAAYIGGAAVAVGALLYYLTREDSVEASKAETKEIEKLDVKKATQAQVQLVLQKIIESQEMMKAVMKDLCAELSKNNYTFDQVYQKVKAVQPEDPLEASGLSMAEFDQLLEKFHREPSIRDSIGKIMGAPGPSGFSGKVNSIKRDEIIEVHRLMLEQLKELVKEFHSLPNTDDYDMKTVTIAAQAIVGTKVESKYNLNSEEIEAAVLLHHQSLSTDPEFARMNVQMQSTMSELMGSQFSSALF